VYRRILDPIYDNEKENWRILTDKEIYTTVKKPAVTETIRLHRLCWFGDIHRVEGNTIVLVWGCTEWKEIELCWFGDVQRVEGNRIVLVWTCTENGRK
jgi:hypothetical protein